MQMSLRLPEVDRELTKSEVEAALEKYKIYLLMEPIEYQPKITASFSIVPPTYNNQFHSNTEEIVVKKIDMENQRRKFLKWVQTCVNRLPHQERSIIVKRYLNAEEIYDYETYNDLGLSERTYYRVKPKALLRLAFIMRIEVYKEEKEAI
ncbi:ArpU family phage packaging/lysis transcriptional regulator [Gracilibacillus marinus]|uniref:ArpU family phage packaging/lysis transcriptional regulator n=1 Tax=Gracilibacillus marinus TaxID=630535 RepID=A0ABV8W1K7_9BACI